MGRAKKAEGRDPDAGLLKEVEALRRRVEELEQANGETKRAASEPRETEGSYPRIFDNLHDTYYRADNEGRVVMASPSGQKMLGYEAGEAIGLDLAKDFYVNPEDRQRFLEIMEKHGYVREFEAQLKKKDGTVIWVSTNASFYKDEEGNVLGVEGISRDITERKRSEEALRKSEEWFRSLIEFGASVYTVVDGEGRITYESPSAQRIFGWRPEELEGKDAFHLVHPDDVERARQVFDDALSQPGVVKSVELRLRHKNASWRTAEVTGVNLLDNDSVSGVVLTSTDVTERKWAEEALKQEKGRFSAFIEDSAFGYVEMDLQGRLTFANRRVEEMSGYSADELHKMHFSELIVPEELERAQKELGQALAEPNSGPRYHKVKRKDGALVSIEANTLPLTRGGRPFGFQVTVEDIGGRGEPA